MSRATELAAILSRKGYVHREKDCLEAAALLFELERELAEAVRTLDEVAPFRTCNGCGKKFRSHELIWEEGDRLECFDCNTRFNAQERGLPIG